MKKTFFSLFIIALMAAMTTIWTGCDTYVVNPEENQPINQDVSFLVKDQVTGDVIAVDSVAQNQALLMVGTTTISNVKYWQWTWGDGTNQDTGRLGLHKFTTIGTYTIYLKVYDSSWTMLGSTNKTLRVFGSTSNVKPIFKRLASSSIGNGQYSVTYGVLRKAIQCTITQPFIVFSEISGWNPINLNAQDTTLDGYYRYTETVNNYSIRKFSYGGNFPDCYAWMEPNLPYWSNEFYVQSELKTCVKWIDGEAYTITAITPLPGTVGDAGTTPVMRAGLSKNADTLFLYFNKNRVSGSHNSPFWVNSLSGLQNPLTLNSAAGYADWWVAAIPRSTIPQNYVVQIKYGDSFNGNNSNWASMSTSYFWNANVGVLEFDNGQMGGFMIIKDPHGRSYKVL